MSNLIKAHPTGTGLRTLERVLDRVPPEAVTKAIEIVADVVRANKVIEARAQEFEHELSTLRESNIDRKDRMGMLIDLLGRMRLPNEVQSRVVESICKIAEGG